MSEDRIKELENFTEDFNRRLRRAKERYEQSKSIELSKDQKNNNNIVINKSHRLIKHKNRYVNNIFYIYLILK
jgi:hypothetical protein